MNTDALHVSTRRLTWFPAQVHTPMHYGFLLLLFSSHLHRPHTLFTWQYKSVRDLDRFEGSRAGWGEGDWVWPQWSERQAQGEGGGRSVTVDMMMRLFLIVFWFFFQVWAQCGGNALVMEEMTDNDHWTRMQQYRTQQRQLLERGTKRKKKRMKRKGRYATRTWKNLNEMKNKRGKAHLKIKRRPQAAVSRPQRLISGSGSIHALDSFTFSDSFF